MKTATLRPGLLVALGTRIKGAVNYERREIEPEHDDGEGGREARWETYRHILDAQEFEDAVKVRSKARSLITGACVGSSFGLLCTTENEGALMAAIEEARALTDAFNARASSARVEVYALIGRIAADEVEAARAIGAEVRELLDAMQAGIRAADPEAIREAANKARELGQMLTADVAGKVSEAIQQARGAAREIVRRVEKSGETAAKVVADLSMRKIEEARFAFLDMDEGKAEPIAPGARGGLDLEPAAPPPLNAAPSAFDFGPIGGGAS